MHGGQDAGASAVTVGSEYTSGVMTVSDTGIDETVSGTGVEEINDTENRTGVRGATPCIASDTPTGG